MPYKPQYNAVEKVVFEAQDYAAPADRAKVDALIGNAEKRTVLTFYRGDNRTMDEIGRTGFMAFNQTYSLEQGRNLIAHLFTCRNFCQDFAQWWIYPASCRTIPQNDAPFVSTGMDGGHYGKYEYKIELKKFTLYKVPSLPVVKCWVGFDGDTLADSTIMGIQVNQGEFDFIKGIPAEYISLR